MTPKYSQISWWSHNIFMPQKYSFSWKPPKIVKFKFLNKKKCPEPMYVWRYQSAPTPGRTDSSRNHFGLEYILVAKFSPHAKLPCLIFCSFLAAAKEPLNLIHVVLNLRSDCNTKPWKAMRRCLNYWLKSNLRRILYVCISIFSTLIKD